MAATVGGSAATSKADVADDGPTAAFVTVQQGEMHVSWSRYTVPRSMTIIKQRKC